MKVSFSRIVRFRDGEGQVYYGDAGSDWNKDLRGQSIEVFQGSQPWDTNFDRSGNHAVVSEVSHVFGELRRTQS
jgi:hypothetical protein